MDPNRLTCKASAIVVLQDICACYRLVLIEANAMVLGCFLSETHSPQYLSLLYSLYDSIPQVGQSLALSEQLPRPNPENQ